ncbi:MAG TPA: hypothetical protein VFY36_12540 [Solirubrobacteraceae bacterium]|nr:hypothetical protein [Solirubrobacteraceae bacterium]
MGLAGCSTNPTGTWVTQRNLGLVLADKDTRFSIRDRDWRAPRRG